MLSKAHALLLLVAAAVFAPACAPSAPSSVDDEETASTEEALSLAGAAAKELSAAIVSQGKDKKIDAEAHGTLLHKCTSKGTRTRVVLEVYVFERSMENDSSPGAVVACTNGGANRVTVPAQISLASGSGYYWNDDTSFTLGGKSFGLSVNDPEDYGYTESQPSRKQLQFDCTHAPDGWGPFDM